MKLEVLKSSYTYPEASESDFAEQENFAEPSK